MIFQFYTKMSINLCNRLLAACFPSSVRWLILLLSFGALSSLFANLQLFNLVVLYTEPSQQRLLLPDELGGISGLTLNFKKLKIILFHITMLTNEFNKGKICICDR